MADGLRPHRLRGDIHHADTRWLISPLPLLREGVKILPVRTEEIGEGHALLVDDHLAPAQFDERVLGQEAEESFFIPDEEFEQFVVVNVAGGDE